MEPDHTTEDSNLTIREVFVQVAKKIEGKLSKKKMAQEIQGKTYGKLVIYSSLRSLLSRCSSTRNCGKPVKRIKKKLRKAEKTREKCPLVLVRI